MATRGDDELTARQQTQLAWIQLLEEREAAIRRAMMAATAGAGRSGASSGEDGGGDDIDCDPIERVKAFCDQKATYSVRYKWVPPGYYGMSMEERGRLLGCPVEHLCKTMVMENKEYTQGDCSDPLNSRYYLVVVQYAARLNPGKLDKAVCALKPPEERLPRKRFHMQVAPEEVGLTMTGFPHNGVTPFGSRDTLPVFLSAAVAALRPGYLWLGGGHPLLKLCVSVADFSSALRPFVADISDPRALGSPASGLDDSETD